MKTSAKGLQILKHFEGLKLGPYYCSADVATIGYGSTRYENGERVKISDSKIDEQRAEELLQNTLIGFENGVKRLIKAPLSQEMFDALVCFAYNIGLGNLRASTLRQKLNRLDYFAIPPQFLRWNKAGGRTLRGLTRRRKAEADLFEVGIREIL